MNELEAMLAGVRDAPVTIAMQFGRSRTLAEDMEGLAAFERRMRYQIFDGFALPMHLFGGPIVHSTS